MNTNSRTSNSTKNAVISVAMQLLILIASFISRTVFIKLLGDQYLGISGLYTNLLSVLSLADLGITTVMTFSLYKPIAEHDENTIASLIKYFKRLYRYIALAITILGLACVPFLQYVINGSRLSFHDLRLYYVLFLANSVCSYLVVYKSTLISADQRIYITKIVEFVARMIAEIVMIAVLVMTGNYLIYLLANVSVTILKNILLSIIADKMYPFLKGGNVKEVDSTVKSKLLSNMKSLFIYRVSSMIMNSTDNILISVILGTVIVGYYSNYSLITSALNTFIMLIAQSVLASIGNYNYTSKNENKLCVFNSCLLIFYFISSICACCFLTMFNDFIYVWIGTNNPNYILSKFDVICISINFFIGCVLNPIWMYREATGIFNQTKYSMTFAAVLNIIFSIIFGKMLGLGGIVIATALSKICTNFWYEPMVLYREIFKTSVKSYWEYIGKELLISILCIIVSVFVCYFVPCNIVNVFVKIAISIILTSTLFVAFNFKTKEFNYLKDKFLPKKLVKENKGE